MKGFNKKFYHANSSANSWKKHVTSGHKYAVKKKKKTSTLIPLEI